MKYPTPLAHCPHCHIPLVQEYQSFTHCPRCFWFVPIVTLTAAAESLRTDSDRPEMHIGTPSGEWGQLPRS